MKQKLLVIVTILLMIPNLSLAAHTFRLDDNFKFLPGVLFQFDGIVINGITAEKAANDAWNGAAPSADKAIAQVYDEFNNGIRVRYNNIENLNIELSNITGRSSYYTHSSNPYDFIKVGNKYIHWLSYPDSEETCEHYSHEEMQRHASVFVERMKLWVELKKEERTLKSRGDAAGRAVLEKAVSDALAPYVDVQMKEVEKRAEDYNKNIKNIKCNAKITYNPQYPALTGYCKERKLCHFKAGFRQNDLIDVVCDCGHTVEYHHFKN